MLLKRIKGKLSLIKNCYLFSKQDGYYNELERKTRHQRFKDLWKWARKWKEFNGFYYVYGLDVKGSNIDDYLGYSYMKKIRDERNNVQSCESHAFLLRNKFYFSIAADYYKFPIPQTLGIYKNGVLYDNKNNEITINQLEKTSFILKDVTGLCGQSVFKIKNLEEFQTWMNENKKGQFLLQELITQHHLISKVNEKAVNTVRIVTKKNHDGKCEVVFAVFRVGTSKSNFVDNWAQGGLMIPINVENGKLTKYGFYKPPYGGKATEHPDSGVVFEDYQIPYFEEAKQLVCKFHECLDLYSIGWDIAITENGPVFVEGNDNWDLAFGQITCKNFKDKLWK